ncbi:MAG TPA: M6 family metalloprotease domain-containing protein [Candidatus Limnocylindria bacterium]|nr:M6 family metalloprotease domain-containing protein [Candidatus Limnocylindria bacterium]
MHALIRPSLQATWLFLALAATPLTARATMPTRTGPLPPAVVSAFESGLFAVPVAPGGLRTASVQPVWYLPVVMVSFTDQPLTYDAAGFEHALFDTSGTTATGSVFDYYQWVSGQRVRVIGKVVATIHLPHEKNHYANGSWGLSTTSTPRNTAGAVLDAINGADTDVDWNPFDQDHDGFVDMVWVIHSGLPGEATINRDNLWSITSRLSAWSGSGAFRTNDPIPGVPFAFLRIDRFTMLPELSAIRPGARSEIGVYCHEFGHALGLPDLYDTSGSGNVGLGCWSLMATGGYGGEGQTPEYPTHVGAWPSLFMGWNHTVRPVMDTLVTMGPIERGAPILELWFQGEANAEHFLIESRRRESFDRNLPNDGLIVYHVDDAAIGLGLPSNRVIGGANQGMLLLAADGLSDLVTGMNRGDSRDPFPGALNRTQIDDHTMPSLRTFSGAIANLAIREITPIGDDVRFRAQVRAPGWLPPENHSGGPYQPVASFGPATRAVRHQDGTISWVGSELQNGRPQIVLRVKRGGEVWDPPLTITASPGSALDPSVAALPGGDLAVVWSDTRHGTRELYYRSRLGELWTEARRLTDLAGDSRNPSLAADPHGGMHLAWIYNDVGTPRLMFMYFTYYSPFGDPRPMTDAGERPDSPALVATEDGGSYIVWSDRGTPSATLWFAHFDPDSGVSVKRRVFESGGPPQTSPSVVVEPGTGSLDIVWQTTGLTGNQIHHQRRFAYTARPDPYDDTVEGRGESLQDIVLARDGQGGIHLAFGTVNSGVLQIRYKLWQPGIGWDRVSTEVTLPADGSSSRPAVLAASPGDLSVLYTGFIAGQPTFMERRRDLNPPVTASVATPARSRPPSIAVTPNPVRAGAGLVVRGIGTPAADRLEVFDLAGRRMSAVPIVREGETWSARLAAGETASWRSGIYLARLHGSRAAHAHVVVIR